MTRLNHSLPLVTTFLLATMLLTSCGMFKKDKSTSPRTSGIENFDRFYDRFHQDPQFQLSRINFPIEGKMIDSGMESEWTRDNWMMMKVKIQDIDQNEFKTTFDKSPTSFYQKFWAEDAGFFAEYRFELIGNKWFLVYAKDVNL